MSAAKKRRAGTVRVRQVRSGIGFSKRQNATLKALGLSKVGRVKVFEDTPQVRGMVQSIPHLVTIESDEGERS